MRFLVLLVAIAATATPTRALTTATPADTIRVSLVTFYPGSDIYELFGHSEIRVTDPRYGDIYFNYGVFDFAAPNFLYRFITGETDYWCLPVPPRFAAEPGEHRRMVEQELNLTQEQARRLSDMLTENAQPGNNTYRYKYFSDNCATRPRDMIERAVGCEMRYDGSDDANLRRPLTFRRVMRHYTAHYPWEQFGIDLLLGSACDTAITWRQAMFVPLVLRHAAARSVIATDSASRPLVRRELTLVDGDEQGTVLPPTPWYLSPMAAALLLLAFAAVVTAVERKRNRRARLSRWLDCLLWLTLGLMGGIIAFLLLFSSHEAVAPNFNILWLHPLYLVMAIMVWFKRTQRALRAISVANLVLIAAMAVVWLSGLQVPHPAFVPLAATAALRAAARLF